VAADSVPPGRGRPRRLVLLGSVLVDIVLAAPALPPRGGDVLGRHVSLGAGGGFTVLTAASRLGLPATYGGAHGGGPMGDRVRADLAAAGIAVELAPSLDADTGYCVVVVEPDGERTFLTAPGVEAALTTEQLAQVEIRGEDAVYVSGYDLVYPVNGPVLAELVSTLPPGPLVVLDTGPLAGEIPVDRWAAVTARADVVSLTAHEARQLYGRDLPTRGPTFVVRQGRDGADVVERGHVTHVPGHPLRPVDTTGAGDVHVGALLAALATGAGLNEATRVANRAAAFSVLRPGPATGPTTEELSSFGRG
jgi:sugar/nucleoside kinase (ribokinase family)